MIGTISKSTADGISQMITSAECFAVHFAEVAAGKIPTHDPETLQDMAEDLAADLATLEDLATAVSDVAK